MTSPPPPRDTQAALFIDVDGTLLEIAPRPALVRVAPTLPVLLSQLTNQHGGALALVSGRRIVDIDRLFEPWHGAAAGLHGGERRRPDGSYARMGDAPLDLVAAASLDRLRPVLGEATRRWPGVRLEDKGRTLALHYRDAPTKAGELEIFAETLLREEGEGLRLISGKMVFEFQPEHYGKDGAIAAFLAEPPFRGRPPVFLGDDTTDEDGFAEVNRRGGVSIRVGPPRPTTLAAYTLPTVAATLEWLSTSATAD